MKIFEKYHKDFKTFGWILEIGNPYKNITELKNEPKENR